MVLGASTVGIRSQSGCRPLSVPSPPTQISPSMPSRCSRSKIFSMRLAIVRVDVIARGAQNRAALGRIELRNGVEQRIQMHVRHARVEQAVEALDEAEHLDPQLVGADDGAVDRGVQGRRVAAGGQDSDAFHEWFLDFRYRDGTVIGTPLSLAPIFSIRGTARRAQFWASG